MSNAITQYRVAFTQPTATGNVEGSTKWFDSLEEAISSKWMSEDNAKIISREYTSEPFPWKHYLQAV